MYLVLGLSVDSDTFLGGTLDYFFFCSARFILWIIFCCDSDTDHELFFLCSFGHGLLTLTLLYFT